jgi:hypothetical protein
LAHVLCAILVTDNTVEAKGAPLGNAFGVTFAVFSCHSITRLKIVGNIPVGPKASHGVGVSSLAVAGINHVVSLLLQIVSEIVLSLIVSLLYPHDLLLQLLWRLVQRCAKRFTRICAGASMCSLCRTLEIISDPSFLLNGLLHPL